MLVHKMQTAMDENAIEELSTVLAKVLLRCAKELLKRGSHEKSLGTENAGPMDRLPAASEMDGDPGSGFPDAVFGGSRDVRSHVI